MELSSKEILENLYKKLEHFQPEDQLDGVWAYKSLARVLQREDHQKVVQAYYDDKYKAI